MAGALMDPDDLPDDLPELPDDVVIPDDLSALDFDLPEELAAELGSWDSGEDESSDATASWAVEQPGASPNQSLSTESDSDDLSLPDDFEIPDDLSGFDPTTLASKAKRELAILITRLAFPGALAGACALAGIEADAVGTEGGAVALLHKIDDEAPEQAGQLLSSVVRGVPLLLVTKAEGQISVTQFLDGKDIGPLPPGVVLTTAPELVEDLIIGVVKPSAVPGTVSSVGISKVKALKLIADSSRPPGGGTGRLGRGGAFGRKKPK